jgi:hypothetical protein
MTQANTTPAVPAVKPNARAHLRNLFAKVGDKATHAQVFGIVKKDGKEVAIFHPVTIKTHLTDFKNPTYAGKQGTMNIVKMTDGTYQRVADTPAKKAEPAKAA